jgi:hypothetical protein
LSISALNFDLKFKAEFSTFSNLTQAGRRNSKIAGTPTLKFFFMYLLAKRWTGATTSGWTRFILFFFVHFHRDFDTNLASRTRSFEVVRDPQWMTLIILTLLESVGKNFA